MAVALSKEEPKESDSDNPLDSKPSIRWILQNIPDIEDDAQAIKEEILNLAKEIRSEWAKVRRAQNEELKRANPLPVVEGRYGTIVIDPPWDMQKIERDVRPNQVEFDYPTMSAEELAAFPLADMAADDCHLFCWTTQKYLPVAFRLLEA